MRNYLIIMLLLASHGLAHAGAYEDILKAVSGNDTSAVVDLLQRGMDVNTADQAGTTLLMIAARNGNLPLVQMLLTNRASVNRRNQHGDTALMMAALGGKLEAVQALIGKSAEVNPAGWTPLHYSIFGGSEEVSKLLIASGAKLDSRAPNGQTSLMLAVKSGRRELVELLVDADADMDLEDYDGVTAIGLAKKLDHTEIVEYLRKVGAVE